MAEFDALGDAYDRTAVEMPFREHAESYSTRLALGDITGLAVLDIGCGSGVYTRRFADWGASTVVGIDVSEGMLATARATELSRQTRIQYLQRDASAPNPAGDPELEGRFDLVASVYAICYATSEEELVGFFTTARRALKPAGRRLVVTTLNPDYGGGDYYAPYGFTLSEPQAGEGSPVTLNVKLSDGEFTVVARRWSLHAYAEAAASVGFTGLSWTYPTVSDEGLAKYGRDYFDQYLARPNAVILEATAEPDG